MTISKEKDDYNYGIGIIRAFMTFCVILCHFWDSEGVAFPWIILDSLKHAAVPTFMLISFYLCGKRLASVDWQYLKRRLKRLIVPFCCWPLIISVVLFIGNKIGLEAYLIGKVALRDIITQLVWGSNRVICGQLWFVWVMILLTLLIFGVFIVLPEKVAKWLLVLISVVCFLLQYTQINYMMFDGLPFEPNISLGRLIEMLPYACMGTLLSLVDIDRKIKNQMCLLLLAIALGLGCINEPFKISRSFWYSGIWLYVITICISCVGIVWKMNNLPQVMKRTVRFLATYSFGVYVIHYHVGTAIIRFMESNGKVYFFFQNVIVWVVCYIIIFALSMIPGKFVKMMIE